MSQVQSQPGAGETSITSFDVDAGVQQPETPEQDEQPPAFQEPQAPSPQRDQDTPPPPTPEPPRALSVNPVSRPVITVSPEELAASDISNLPRRRPDRPSGAAYGPSMPSSSPGDSQIVGQAPNGEPLYGARWYREPTQQEMAGYLSTADPGSWALIACKTAPGWRVEDCVGVDQYPTGSNLQRAVLAAAWQFEVRPPQRGGRSLVGSWVRIRIDYRRAER